VISFKSGLKNGEKKEYRSDGSVNSIKNYKNDVLHGSFVKFYGGEIYISGNYENGKKHGNWLKYYEGEGSLESAYKLGVPNGIWKAHFLASGARKDSLNLRDQVEYEYEVYNGVVINPIKIYEYTNIYSYYGKVQKQYWQGNIDVKTAEPAKARYFNKTGVWKKYNMQGKILGQLENKNGVEISKTTYFSNGNKSEEFEIKDGIYYYTYYWENGNLRNKGTSLNNISGEYIKFEAYWTDGEKLQEQYQNKNIKFKNGKKHEVFEQSKWGVDHGKYIKYYQNTEVEIRGFYENDKKSGLWKYYNEKGKLIKTENYSNGIKQ
jgi:antitoxin component YwqK of YwqJK toxin-antitoxin module